MVGLRGLEPPTLRLSGVRSNHLSYKPSSSQSPFRSVSSQSWKLHALPCSSSSFQTRFAGLWNDFGFSGRWFSLSFALGGDEEDRTPDPLLARQVLSQLSYTPISQWGVWKEEWGVFHTLSSAVLLTDLWQGWGQFFSFSTFWRSILLAEAYTFQIKQRSALCELRLTIGYAVFYRVSLGFGFG